MRHPAVVAAVSDESFFYEEHEFEGEAEREGEGGRGRRGREEVGWF